MITTTVFPQQFTFTTASGKMLPMTRLFRFRLYEGGPVKQDFVAAMEASRAPFLNQPERLDVFRITPTGKAKWVPLHEEEIYTAAHLFYDNYQGAGHFIGIYRERLCGLFAPEVILPYMEELEISLIGHENARETAISMCDTFGEKQEVLLALHNAMCTADNGTDMHNAADRLALTLWGRADGMETAKTLLGEVTEKAELLEKLYARLLLDGGNAVDQQAARAYLLQTCWARPCSVYAVRRALDEHSRKSAGIKQLLAIRNELGDSCSVTEEAIQGLWFCSAWELRRYRLLHTLCK